jgi:hypothetical protein
VAGAAETVGEGIENEALAEADVEVHLIGVDIAASSVDMTRSSRGGSMMAHALLESPKHLGSRIECALGERTAGILATVDI